ncbi:MAG: hypothetical protein INR73_04775 [Williamsia sp.]|nr:hypothetical protein [Williamsia sp.]
MKKTLLSSLLLSVVGIISASAQDFKLGSDYQLGVGIRLSTGAPTISNSVSLKYFLTPSTAAEGLISFGNRFGVGGLYELHQSLNSPGLRWFYGGGGYVGTQHRSTYLGPMGVLGLDYKFSEIPLNLSLDWKPELDLLPKINFVPDALALTARFTIQ